jgi:hypothetical protein
MLKIVGFIITAAFGGLAGFICRYGVGDWQYWVTAAPLSAWIGATGFFAFCNT